MSTKKATKFKSEKQVFLTGSVSDFTNPHISVFYDAPCNSLNLIVNYGEMTYHDLQIILENYQLELISSSKIKVYYA